MPESRDRVTLGKLNHLAYKAWLYQVSDSATATALAPACFALIAGNSKGLPVRLLSVRVSSTAALSLQFGSVASDPALTAGNAASNLYLGGAAPQAFNEAQVTTAPSLAAILTQAELGAGGTLELLSPGVLYMPPNSGVSIISAEVAATLCVTWLWAELPPEDFGLVIPD